METKKEIGQRVQKLWQVHTKASSGASPVTSQLRWARLDVTGLAPLHSKLLVTEVEPLDTGGDTHKPPIPAQVCRTLKVELCTESANIGAVKN